MTDRENLCIANTAAGRSGAKRGIRWGRYRKMPDGWKNPLPAGWWGKCDCELSDAMQIGQRAIHDPPDPGAIRRHPRITIGVSATRREGVIVIQAGSVFCLWRLGIHSQLYVNFHECWLGSMYSNWFIENRLMDGRLAKILGLKT